MKSLATPLVLALFANTLVGCVSNKKHEALQSMYSDLQEENRRLNGDLTQEERANAALDRKNNALANRTNALESDVERQARALQELRDRQALSQARVDAYQDLVSRFADLIDAGTLSIKVVDGRMVVQLPTDILFPSGSAELSAEGKSQLADVGAVLATLPRTYQVEGHTDSDAISTERFPSNWELASARATTVLRVMKEAGVPVNQLSTAGFADTRPVASNETAEGKRQNRRIEIALMPDLSLLPGAEALRDAAQDGISEGDAQ